MVSDDPTTRTCAHDAQSSSEIASSKHLGTRATLSTGKMPLSIFMILHTLLRAGEQQFD